MPGVFEKLDATFDERCMVAGKVVGLEKEADSPAGLVAHPLRLRDAVCLGEEELCSALDRDGHPALATAEIGVADQLETQRADVEMDRLVAVGNDEGDGRK